jgi:hypothetical protein
MWSKGARKQLLFPPKTINLRNGSWGVEGKSPRPRFFRWRDDKPLISTHLSKVRLMVAKLSTEAMGVLVFGYCNLGFDVSMVTHLL